MWGMMMVMNNRVWVMDYRVVDRMMDHRVMSRMMDYRVMQYRVVGRRWVMHYRVVCRLGRSWFVSWMRHNWWWGIV